MKNRNATLRNSLPAICSAVAARKGVKIIWKGPPKTEGTTIWSNPIPVDADEETIKMVIGSIDHECGHIRRTNFRLLNQKKLGGLQHALWNALEDIFIERKLGDDYVGCQQTLAESAEILVKKGKCRMGTNGPSDALATFCHAWGRKNVLFHEVDPVLESAKGELVKHIEESGVERLEALLATKLYSANSTKEVLDLSGAILRLIKDIRDEQEKPGPKEPENKPDQQSGETGESQGAAGDNDQNDEPNQDGSQTGSQNGDGASNESGKPDPNSNEEGEGTGEGGLPTGAQSGPEAEGNTGNGVTADDATVGDGAGRGGSAREILEDANVSADPVIDRQKAAGEMTEEAVRNGNFIFNPRSYQKPPGGTNLPRYNALKAAVSGHIAQLQRRLAVEFQSKRHSRSVLSEEGRLDGRKIHQAIMGNPAVFRKKVVTQVPNPAVSLVLDCSGSMRPDAADKRTGGPIELATQAVIALAEVCNTMNVQTEVVTYSGNSLGAVKPFETQLVKARGRIGAIDAGGGTPTAEALWLAGNRLFNRKEDRKILILVTDGQPDDLAGAQQVATMIERSGIELYGIGLGTDAIRYVCKKAGVVVQASDLAPAILNALAERMLSVA